MRASQLPIRVKSLVIPNKGTHNKIIATIIFIAESKGNKFYLILNGAIFDLVF